jgi:hypothetical protein
MKDKSNLAIPHSSESGTIKTIDAFKVQMNSAAKILKCNRYGKMDDSVFE